jgi:hypothetical protein
LARWVAWLELVSVVRDRRVAVGDEGTPGRSAVVNASRSARSPRCHCPRAGTACHAGRPVTWSCCCPISLGVVVEQVDQMPGLVCILVRARSADGRCPRCGMVSSRVHSRYERRLADAAAGGQWVVIRLRVRRFFCGAPDCPACTFAEQVDGLTTAYARRTPLLRGMLEVIALALAGRAGARLAGGFGLPAGRSTMLRLIRALPDPGVTGVAVLGVDDFALRRGARLRERAGEHGHAPPGGPAARPGGRHVRRLAARPSRHPGDLPGPRRSLRRPSQSRRTRGDPVR